MTARAAQLHARVIVGRQAARHHWWKLRQWAWDMVVYKGIARIFNLIATKSMRHAAFLLGFDLAFGCPSDGLLTMLPEHSTGNEIAFMILHGDDAERQAGWQSLALERQALGQFPIPVEARSR